MSLYAVALRFHFTGTKMGLAPPPPPSLTVGTMHQGRWHSPNPDSSIGLPDGDVGFTTPENAFPLLQSPMAASFTPLQSTLGITHGDLTFVCRCSAMETHFMKLPNSSCADVASRGSLELSSECCNRGQTIFYAHQRSRSVSLCGFNFTITALTVDQGSSSRAPCRKGGIL